MAITSDRNKFDQTYKKGRVANGCKNATVGASFIFVSYLDTMLATVKLIGR